MENNSQKSKKYKRYLIVSDESTRHGKNYSYFFGGCILEEKNYDTVSFVLNLLKNNFNLNELKRQKINDYNVDDYIFIIDTFFNFVKAGLIKVRIMYAPNTQLNSFRNGQVDSYEKFYYLFLKNAFSLFDSKQNMFLRLYLDELPETLQKNNDLKTYLSRLFLKKSFSGETENKVLLYKSRIEEVNSKDHIILQCINVILGVIDFYLNTTEEEKGSKRGIAKMKLFKTIHQHILSLCPEFDFNKSTGYFKCLKAWNSSYKHLVFKKLKKTPELSTYTLQRDNADIR